MVDLLVCMETANVLLKFHWIVGAEGAEITLQLLLARVPLSLVSLEEELAGAGEVTLRTVEGLVCAQVLLHGLSALEQSIARMMATLDSFDAMSVLHVPLELFFVSALKSAVLVEASQRLALFGQVVGFHVGLEHLALTEGVSTGGTGVLVRVVISSCLVSMHTGQVPSEGVALHCFVLAQVAVVRLLAGLSEHVDAQLALTREVVLAVGALQPWVGEMQVHVLHQVGPSFETASALGAYVGAVQVLIALNNVTFS